MEGTLSELQCRLPVKATFSADDHAVININNMAVTGDTAINLRDVNTIETQGAGKVNMTLSAFGFPMKNVTLNILPGMEVVPCGMTVGVKINTAGVLVLGTGEVSGLDGKPHKPSEGILKSGDLIIQANTQNIKNKEQLGDIIKEGELPISLTVRRKNEIINAEVTPVASSETDGNQIGVWVRDGTKGIGTVTYYNPATNGFAALGHGILDVDTKQIISIKNGSISETEITSVVQGKKGAPGELRGDIGGGSTLGRVEHNSPYGIYGSIDSHARGKMPKEKMPVGLQDKAHEGPATIRCNVDGNKVGEYDIYIETVNRGSADDMRGMVVRITDPALLAKTGGIVQGMSGSPILQDGRIIGAVTHVFVQDPSKGYGIFIENMLKHELSMK